MALVVLLRGVNVGGHRAFRPTMLARQLSHLDAVNIGAAGTFVIRRPISVANLRAEVGRRLPFEAEVAREDRFLVGLYRRQMSAITCLGRLVGRSSTRVPEPRSAFGMLKHTR